MYNQGYVSSWQVTATRRRGCTCLPLVNTVASRLRPSKPHTSSLCLCIHSAIISWRCCTLIYCSHVAIQVPDECVATNSPPVARNWQQTQNSTLQHLKSVSMTCSSYLRITYITTPPALPALPALADWTHHAGRGIDLVQKWHTTDKDAMLKQLCKAAVDGERA